MLMVSLPYWRAHIIDSTAADPEPVKACESLFRFFGFDAPLSSGFSNFLGMADAEGVSEHGAVDGVGEVALEDAHGLALGVPS